MLRGDPNLGPQVCHIKVTYGGAWAQGVFMTWGRGRVVGWGGGGRGQSLSVTLTVTVFSDFSVTFWGFLGLFWGLIWVWP